MIMEKHSDQGHSLLRQSSSQFSKYSLSSNSTLVTSPSSPPLHRNGHRRANSVIDEDASNHEASVSQQDGHGLGISNLNEQNRVSITRKPVRSKGSSGSADLLLSPMSAYRSGETRFDEDQEENLQSDPNLPFTPISDREPLQKSLSPMGAEFECKLKKEPTSGRGTWLAVSVMMLSIYSTTFSGIWLFIAIIKPRYGRTVSSTGNLPFPIAATLYAAIAKSIELSFVTVFVALIGQILSKRAIMQPKGVTIAEISMRSWVMQPGRCIPEQLFT